MICPLWRYYTVSSHFSFIIILFLNQTKFFTVTYNTINVTLHLLDVLLFWASIPRASCFSQKAFFFILQYSPDNSSGKKFLNFFRERIKFFLLDGCTYNCVKMFANCLISYVCVFISWSTLTMLKTVFTKHAYYIFKK